MSEFHQSSILERVRAFGEALPEHHRLLIIPHDYPDPDALAAAAGVHLLLNEHFHRPSQIAFSGDVTRAENKEFLRRMKFRWHRLSDLRAHVKHVGCIYVDTAPWSRNVTVPPHTRALAIFDHHKHKPPARWRIPFMNIRPGAGATTTLVYEFLKAAEVEIPRWLAALMAYALASETQDLSREATDSEHEAYAELSARADLKIIGRIRHARLPVEYFAYLQAALTAARRYEDITWTHLPAVAQPEILAEVADLLLRTEGVRWSFCTSFIGERLFVSMRSSHRAARCSRILRSAIAGRGGSGGHHAMAAGALDLTDCESEFDRLHARADFERALIKRLPAGRRAADEPDALAGVALIGEPVVS